MQSKKDAKDRVPSHIRVRRFIIGSMYEFPGGENSRNDSVMAFRRVKENIKKTEISTETAAFQGKQIVLYHNDDNDDSDGSVMLKSGWLCVKNAVGRRPRAVGPVRRVVTGTETDETDDPAPVVASLSPNRHGFTGRSSGSRYRSGGGPTARSLPPLPPPQGHKCRCV